MKSKSDLTILTELTARFSLPAADAIGVGGWGERHRGLVRRRAAAGEEQKPVALELPHGRCAAVPAEQARSQHIAIEAPGALDILETTLRQRSPGGPCGAGS